MDSCKDFSLNTTHKLGVILHVNERNTAAGDEISYHLSMKLQ